MTDILFDGDKLKYLREKKGWSLQKLAEELSTPEKPVTAEQLQALEKIVEPVTMKDVINFCYELWKEVKNLKMLVESQHSK